MQTRTRNPPTTDLLLKQNLVMKKMLKSMESKPPVPRGNRAQSKIRGERKSSQRMTLDLATIRKSSLQKSSVGTGTSTGMTTGVTSKRVSVGSYVLPCQSQLKIVSLNSALMKPIPTRRSHQRNGSGSVAKMRAIIETSK